MRFQFFWARGTRERITMSRTSSKIAPVGMLDRRNPVVLGESTDVIIRENLLVIGEKKGVRKIKKIPGSDRYNATSVGSTPFVSGYRYYTKKLYRKTFAYNQNGYLYHIDDIGNTSQLLGIFSPLAYPCFETIRVSGGDILLFSEGITAGMYSYDGNPGNTFIKESQVTLNFVDMVGHLDRLFGFEEDSEDLYFSKNLVPTNFTDSTDAGVITIGPKRGSKIQKIWVDNETLYIGKTDSIWVLEGRQPSEFRVREVVPNLGIAARRSVANVSQGVCFLASDYEVYSFVSEKLTLLTYNVAMGGDLSTVSPLGPIINRDRMEQVTACYHNFLYRLSFVEDQGGATKNNMEYIFNTINETDAFTRDNNVSCYIVYDRFPDKKQLVTGRSDIGRLMYQYRGLNWDNQDTNSKMSFRVKTKFIGLEEARNFRLRKTWLNCGTIGGEPVPIRTYLDARNALSDATNDEYAQQGEYKNPITAIKINSQDNITSRGIPRHGSSKGQNISFEINENRRSFDFEMTSFEMEIISKSKKRNHRVGV